MWDPRKPAGFVLLMTGVAFALLMLACAKEKPTRYIADCPQDSIFIPVGGDTVTDIPVASEIDEVPEFHDCQRFRMPNGQYGPLVAIWAATELAKLGPSLTPLPDSNGGTTTVPVPDTMITGSANGFAVAEIFNFGRGEYRELNIKEGFSCLYLSPAPSEESGWAAKIVWLNEEAGPCRPPQNFGALAGEVLTVHSDPLPAGLLPIDVPPVARWDFDSVHTRQYIGIRCGDHWCEVGQPVLAPSPKYALDAASPNQRIRDLTAALASFTSTDPEAERLNRRVLEIKGWYDEQRLGTESGSTIAPTEILGSVFPHPGLGAVSESDYSEGWVPSAFVHVTGPYKGKLSFEQGITIVSICKGTSCGVTAPIGCPTGVSPTDPNQWWARIQPLGRKATYRCVDRMTHSVIPAAAARWRWTEQDEKLWVRCTAGCCTVN